MHMRCSWWICPFYCFLLHYCEASHFDLRNSTFFEYFDRECEALHSKKNVISRNHPYANSACVQFRQNN